MKHVLKLDETYYNFTLIAIEAAAEDCQIAFLLNKYLNLSLKRHKEDLIFSQGDSETNFSLFTYEDDNNQWFLVSNVFSFSYSIGMFNELDAKKYLIPEQKNIKMFLKIEGYIDEVALMGLLSNSSKILSTYVLDPHSLKSKEYLIF